MKNARILLVSVGAAVIVAALPGGEALADRASAHYHKAMAFKRRLAPSAEFSGRQDADFALAARKDGGFH